MTYFRNTLQNLTRLGARLRRDTGGLAMIEFAATLPFFAAVTIGSVETGNYAYISMKINQIALHTADNAARIGDGSQLSLRKISERNINDVLAGAMHEGSRIGIGGSHQAQVTANGTTSTETRGNTRIFLSSVEPMANPNTTNKFKIAWQRCAGTATHFTSTYGTTATTNVDGVGPAGQQTVAPPEGATIFVEIKYRFEPLFTSPYSNIGKKDLSSFASMVVRDRRDFTQVYPVAGVAPSTCA